MRDAFVKTITKIAREDKNVILITGDLGFGVLKPYWEELPNQFINAGIAEQNMTGLAAGMALEGKIVFTYSIGNFPTLRCLEQVRNDCAYHNANVKIVCVGGGFVYGSLGMSHHATEDLAIMRALPNVTVLAPADLTEAVEATIAVYNQAGTCYLRLGRGGEPRIHNKIENFKIGKAIKAKEMDSEVVILSTGAIFDEVCSLDCTIYTFPTVKPIDSETIIHCAQKYKLIVTVEEHNIVGGFGSAVSEVLAELPLAKAQLLRLGLNDTYSEIVGSQKFLRNIYGISAMKIKERIESHGF